MTAATPGSAPASDLVLHHEVVGSGDPAVLIHGLGSSARDWEHQVDALSRRHKVIAVDLRGHGRSARAPGPYSIALFARDVAAVMAHHSIDAAHVCGISLGGMVAFQLAVDAPERVRSLAIINSGPAFPGRTLKGRLVLWTRLGIIRWKGLPALGAIVGQRLFPHPSQEPLRRTFVERFGENDRESYEHTLRAIGRFDVADRLDRIRCPVLVLSGDRDYTPVAAKEAYVRQLADARLIVIRDSGHASPMDQPAAVNEALLDFWSGQVRDSGVRLSGGA
jgi:pimeloyl-ACP methyl ester carboxylesterase